MLNGIKVEIKKSEFEVLPMDRYTCLITDVNLIQQQKFQSTENEDVLNYQFQVLDDKNMQNALGEDVTVRGRLIWHRCRLAFNERSWLCKLSKAVIGRDLTREEINTLDPESLVGKQVDLMLEQNPSKDGQRMFNKVVVFSKNTKPLKPLEGQTVTRGAQVIEKKTAPAVAPDADNEADQLVADLKVEESEESDVADLEAKLAEAKKKRAEALGK